MNKVINDLKSSKNATNKSQLLDHMVGLMGKYLVVLLLLPLLLITRTAVKTKPTGEAYSGSSDSQNATAVERLIHDRLLFLMRMRNRHFLLLDTMALLLTPTIALIMLADGLSWWPDGIQALIFYTVIALVIQLVIFFRMSLYNCYWQYAGIIEQIRIALAAAVSTIIVMAVYAATHRYLVRYGLTTPLSLPIIAGLLTFVAVGGSRFGLRGIYYWLRHRTVSTTRRRLLIVGAGEAGKMAVREIETNPVLNMEAVAFVDDDLHKVGNRIAGLPVVGTLEMIPKVADELNLREVIIAMPSAPLGRQQEVMALCEHSGINVSSLPGLFEILAGYKTISPIPKIDLKCLLDRQPVLIDPSNVATTLDGAKVLVTGAGGSIGSELCRQIASFDPAEIILLGHGENSIFEIGLKLSLDIPDLNHHPVIVDVRDAEGINQIIEKYRPDVIFHAAAHKHVVFMEGSVCEAITNNVLGTLNVVRAAKRHNVPRLVLISTDKAVNPTNIMGATKRIAEFLVKAAAQESGHAYMSVRFGNVLGSRGSVVPVFQSQIQAGGPLRITHPDMRRYFMTIPEAVQLVLQAAALGRGGETFTLDMGEQVRILDLAVNLIEHSGLTIGRDIDIVFSGIRPGEKLEEELFLESETYQKKHPELFVAVDD
ncbi:MAG: polysaccharide biosynthesis protein, partial [Anaerolineaceae bacterium]